MAKQPAEPHPREGVIIDPIFVATMAAYNAEMNRRLYAAASLLSDDERRWDRGAFWGPSTGRCATSCGATARGWRASTAGNGPRRPWPGARR